MSLETASFIPQLNSANPPSGDPIANAADHLRLLKAAVKGSFPNLGNAAVTSTASQLSYGVVPTGGIIIWTGAVNAIPTGWALADGGTYTKSDGSGNITAPDLRDRFVVGAGNSYTVGNTGGSANHTHNLTISGTALAQNNIPDLSIAISDPTHSHYVNDPGHSHVTNTGGSALVQPGAIYNSALSSGGSRSSTEGTGIWLSGATTGISAYTSATGGTTGVAHGHAGSTANSTDGRPPYYALAYIMKL